MPISSGAKKAARTIYMMWTGNLKAEADASNNITATYIRGGRKGVVVGRIPLSQQQAGNTGLDFLERFKWKDFAAKIMNGTIGPWIPIFYNISDAEYVYELVKGVRESSKQGNRPPCLFNGR